MHILCGQCVDLFKCFRPFAIGSFTFIFRHVIDGTRVVAIVPDVKTMSGATFYPLIMMLLMSIDTLWFS